MKAVFWAMVFPFILLACSSKKVEITSEYIINENWSKKNDEVGGNSIKINMMRAKRDNIIYPLSNINSSNISNILEEDSLFRWYANVKIDGESYEGKKIYFNQYNGFTWLDDVENKRKKSIGNLQKGNWYKFSHLVSYPYYIYVYVDSLNIVHRFDVNLANY